MRLRDGEWMRCPIEPLVGADGVRLGMTMDEVARVLGDPAQSRVHSTTTVGYWASGMSVHFNPSAELIEVARGMELAPTLFGAPIFETPAEELVQRLVDLGHPFDPDTEGGHCFVFRSLQLGLWRSVVPEDSEDPEGRFFDSVGLGREGYYR
jgi:hypothetical protein